MTYLLVRNTILYYLWILKIEIQHSKGLWPIQCASPGVVGRGVTDGNFIVQSYEVITTVKALDESNVGNMMLRNMGWQEGLVTFKHLHFNPLYKATPYYYLKNKHSFAHKFK